MFEIAFGIIIAVILLFLLPLIFTFVMGAIGIGFMICLAVAVIFGVLFIVQEIEESVILLSVFIGVTVLGFILHKLIASI